MVFKNSLMNELSIPNERRSRSRLFGFYEDLRWDVWPDSEEKELVYVQPKFCKNVAIAYWQTSNKEKLGHFVLNEEMEPSIFAQGKRLPSLFNLVEVVLVLPSDDDVQRVWRMGGETLQKHAHVPLRQYSGTHEIRFGDLFNYSIRVTGDPGYEI